MASHLIPPIDWWETMKSIFQVAIPVFVAFLPIAIIIILLEIFPDIIKAIKNKFKK